MTTGSCLCGAVRYEMQGPYKWMAHCHCSMCRKHHGSLFATSVGVRPENFRWISGEADIVHFRSSPAFERPFCRCCGSVVPDVSNPDLVTCPAGTLDDIEMKPQAHIFVKSKSPLCEITDALPQFDAYPPGAGEAVADSRTEASQAAPGLTHGSCLCGAVAFEIDEPLTRIVNCHCGRCRRSRGAAHGTNVFAKLDSLRWTRGEEQVRTFKLPDAKLFTTAFCASCGSIVPVVFPRIDRYLVPVGALDSVLAPTSNVHIHVASKAPWFEITDDRPQFATMPAREELSKYFY